MLKNEINNSVFPFIGGRDVEDYSNKILMKSEILIWQKEGFLLGFVSFYCNDYSSHEAFITMLIVTDNARGMGIGSMLFNQVKYISQKRGFKSINLDVHKANLGGVLFYKREGFHEVSENNGFIRMCRPIE
jgi:ribosomal protein S18 acetylase RimI-like enzyme